MNISYVLKKQSINKDGEYPIYIRLRKNLNGKWEETSIPTKIRVLPKYFKKGNIKTNEPSYEVKRDTLGDYYSDIKSLESEGLEEGINPTPKWIKEQLLNKELNEPQQKLTFWNSYDEWFSTKKGFTRGYTKTIITLGNRLKDFEKYSGKKITYNTIVKKSLLFQSNFENFLWETKSLSNSYINKLYGNLSSFLHYSHQNGYIDKKPKLRKLGEVNTDEKVYLQTDEVIKLFNSKKWDFKCEDDLPNNPHLYSIPMKLNGSRGNEFGGIKHITNWELIKDLTLFSCSVGCRYSDLSHFKVNDFNFDKEKEMLSWIVQKTSTENKVPLNDISREIYIKYSEGKKLTQNLFPKLSIQKYNKHLKFLLKDLRFNRLIRKPKKVGSEIVDNDEKELWRVYSSHSNRRSFIKNNIDMGTMDYKTIMKLSSHKTMSQFQKYVSVTDKDIYKSSKLYSLKNDDDNSLDSKIQKMMSKMSKKKKEHILELFG